jgi:hypothetical protein
VQLKVVTEPNWEAAFTGPANNHPTTYSEGGCFSPDPSDYPDFLGSKNLAVGQYNVSDYAPAEVDKLVAAGIGTSNPAGRLAAYSGLVRRPRPTCRTLGFSSGTEPRRCRASSASPITAPTPGPVPTPRSLGQRHKQQGGDLPWW